MGGQNARISKHSAAGREGGRNFHWHFWRLRVRSVWVTRMQGFPSILRRDKQASKEEEKEKEKEGGEAVC